MWKGIDIKSLADLMLAIQRVYSTEDARLFLALYEAENDFARENIGYMIGYINDDYRRQDLYRFFGVSHPIFGLIRPSIEQAQELSRKVALWDIGHPKEPEEKVVLDKTQPKRLIEP